MLRSFENAGPGTTVLTTPLPLWGLRVTGTLHLKAIRRVLWITVVEHTDGRAVFNRHHIVQTCSGLRFAENQSPLTVAAMKENKLVFRDETGGKEQTYYAKYSLCHVYEEYLQ